MNSIKNSKMWGGRFSAGPSEIMQKINASIDIDQRLWPQDIAGSRAHAAMLAAQDIISDEDNAAIQKGLDQVAAELESGEFPFSVALEDIHMNIESRLKEIIGEPAGRIHTGRSRNDQVVTDFKLWCREQTAHMAEDVRTLQMAMVAQAEGHTETIMPGFTHLQNAQCVSFAHHLLAYVEMLERDRTRFLDAYARMNECPLGSAALAGTPFPLDRDSTASALGFDRPTANSLDSVSSRDFALEMVSAIAICATNLSRLAEEIVIWASAPFEFIRLPDDYSTGSSIMPNKKNPDAAELIRGKSGRVIGGLSSLLIMMKGLTLAYAKDMQEDKELTFDAVDTIALCLAAMTGMVAHMTANPKEMRDAAVKGFTTATDMADWLVRVLNMPFRDAHHVTGALVKEAETQGIELSDLSLLDMQAVEPRITESIYDFLTLEASVASRMSYGGTAPKQVMSQVKKWQKIFESEAQG